MKSTIRRRSVILIVLCVAGVVGGAAYWHWISTVGARRDELARSIVGLSVDDAVQKYGLTRHDRSFRGWDAAFLLEKTPYDHPIDDAWIVVKLKDGKISQAKVISD